MGRIKVWENRIQSKQGDILLRLFPCGGAGSGNNCIDGGGVKLCAVNDDGSLIQQGNLLYFHDHLSLEFAQDVNPDIGFKLDEDGEIVSDEPLNEYKSKKEESPINSGIKLVLIDGINEEIKRLEDKKKAILKS